MKLRQKVIIILFAILLGLMLVSYAASQLIVLASFRELEQADAEENLGRATNAIQAEITNLETETRDYAYWDDTYAYMAGENPGYIAENLIPEVYANIRTNLVVIVDTNGQVAYSATYDFETAAPFPNAANLVAEILTFPQLMNQADVNQATSGLIILDEGPLFVSAVPISTSDTTGPSRGTFIYGRLLTTALLTELAESLRLSLQMQRIDLTATLTDDFGQAQDALQNDDTIFTTPLPNERIAAFTRLADINQRPALLIRMDMARSVYAEGQQTVIYFLLAVITGGLILGLGLWFLLDAQVVTPMSRLSQQVHQIGESGDLHERVNLNRSDEVGRLASELNRMVASLEESQEELRQAKEIAEAASASAEASSRVKSEFLDTISFELRDPLNAIEGYTSIMLSGVGVELPANVRRMVERVSENNNRLLEVINDILDFSRLEDNHDAPKLVLVEPSTLLKQWERRAKRLAENKPVTFHSTMDAALPQRLWSNESALHKIVFHLLDKAFKFTEQGEVALTLRSKEEVWQIEVRDTGIGIPAEASHYIFDAFRQVDGSPTREYSGAGMGLALVQRLVTTMHGSISLNSEVGKGSAFTITLPLQRPAKN